MLKITAKLTTELEIFIKDGKAQNNPGEIGQWWGNDITNEIDLTETLKEVSELPDGEYKLTLTIERL